MSQASTHAHQQQQSQTMPQQNKTSTLPTTAVCVPGKVMLAGEYTALSGGKTLTIATAQHMRVSWQKDLPDVEKGLIEVHSNLWPNPKYVQMPSNTSLAAQDSEYDDMLLRSVYASAVELWGRFDAKASSVQTSTQTAVKMPLNGRLRVTSDLEVSFGIGSSSALRLGVIAAMQAQPTDQSFCRLLENDTWPKNEAWTAKHELNDKASEPIPAWLSWARQALRQQRHWQKRASGYDILTQVLGGIVCSSGLSAEEQLWPGHVETQHHSSSLLWAKDNLHVAVGGAGAPTGPLTRTTMQWFQEHPTLWAEYKRASERLVAAFQACLSKACLNTAHLTKACLNKEDLNTARYMDTPPSDSEGNEENHERTLQQLLEAVQTHRKLFSQSPAYPKDLLARLEGLAGCDKEWTFKTTGAGGEDALLLIGPRKRCEQAMRVLEEQGWKTDQVTWGLNASGLNWEQPAPSEISKNSIQSH